MKKLIKVQGMSCKHCVMHITEALGEVPGVTDVVVSLEDGTATVDMNAPVTDEAFAAAITDVGYTLRSVADL